MARRANAPADKIERIEADGEWLTMLTNNVGMGRFAELSKGKSGAELNNNVLAFLIHGWSFADAEGAPLPITAENIRDNDDAPVLIEALKVMQALPFLARLSQPRNPESSS